MSLLSEYERYGAVYVVPMNAVQFIAFGDLKAIGTRDLGACSVVAIVSTFGAILAHIPPLPIPPPPLDSDPDAGDNHARHMIGLVIEEYGRYRNYFPQAYTYIVYATYQGQAALSSQIDIITKSLQTLGHQLKKQTYNVPGDRTSVAQGTVIVISPNPGNETPTVYAEDTIIQ